MLSLNQIKKKTKKYGLLSAKILGILVFVFILYKVGFAIKELFFPSPPPAPETAFGVLPKLSFPVNKDSSTLKYSIDTLTGELPAFPHLIKVYEMKKYTPSLLDLENTQRTVNSANFLGPGIKLTDTVYAWTSRSGSRLSVDILTKDYTLDISLDSNAGEIKSEESAIRAADSFMQSMFPPQDLDTTKTKAFLLFLSGSSMNRTESLSRSNVVAVNYYQNTVDDYPIYYPEGDSSTMKIFVGGASQVVGASFHHQELTDSSSTYPLISSQEAFDLLKSGKGYIAFSKEGLIEVRIKKVYLGYYLGEEKQDFLMPVAIFEGEDFIAYVPAVTSGWVDK